MRIVHNLVRDGKKISGQILYTHFEKGEKLGFVDIIYGGFKLISSGRPALTSAILYVWGIATDMNNDFISCTYSSEEEAIKMMEFINKFTIASDLPADGSVWVRVENKEETESFLKIVGAKGFKWINNKEVLEFIPSNAKAIQYGNNFYYSSGDDWEKHKNISFNEFINGAESKQLKPLPEKWYINVDELPEEYREQFFKFIDGEERIGELSITKLWGMNGGNCRGCTASYITIYKPEQISIEEILIHMGINKPKQDEQTLIATKPKIRTKSVIEEELKREREDFKNFIEDKTRELNTICREIDEKFRKFIEKLDEITEEKQKLEEAVTNAQETAALFAVVSTKLTSLAGALTGDARMLEEYDEAGEIGAMEKLTEEINTKLEVFNDVGLVEAINSLSSILKVKKQSKATTKEDVAKSLGL